jgi:hypothetical protein
MTRKNHNAAAAVLAFALSLLVAPAALAEPFEGDQFGANTATVEPAPGLEQNKSYLEYLERQQLASQSSTAGTIEAQMPKAQVEYLERQAAAAADDSGPGWLLGAGVVTAVAIGSVIVAAIRSRRPETATPAEREREKLTV